MNIAIYVLSIDVESMCTPRVSECSRESISNAFFTMTDSRTRGEVKSPYHGCISRNDKTCSPDGIAAAHKSTIGTPPALYYTSIST